MNAHPSWCLGTEDKDTDHVSATLHAARETDSIDIRLRLTQPELDSAEETRWTMLEIEFVNYDEVSAFPLDMSQARMLIDKLTEVVPARRAPVVVPRQPARRTARPPRLRLS